MFPDKVYLRQFFKPADGCNSLVDQGDKVGHHVPNDTAGLDGRIDPGTVYTLAVDFYDEIFCRYDRNIVNPGVRLFDRLYTKQIKNLGQHFSIRFKRIGTPKA